jgi:sentrin-specific protease 1
LNDRLKKYTKKTDRGKSKQHAKDKIKAIFESEESASAGSNSDSKGIIETETRVRKVMKSIDVEDSIVKICAPFETQLSLSDRIAQLRISLASSSSSTAAKPVSDSIEARITAREEKLTVDKPWETDNDDEESEADTQARMRALLAARHAPLSDADSQRVTNIMRGPATQEELIEKFSIPMTREKLLCLRPTSWLNDEVINFCMSMLQERDDKLRGVNPKRKRSHYFNSFFMDKLLGNGHVGYIYKDVARWTKKFDVFQLDKVFIPVNIGNTHWTMAVVLISRKEIHYYDSMRGEGARYKNGLLRWLVDEAKTKRNFDLDTSEWKLISQYSCPQQQNGYDCGMFTIMCADVMTDDIPVTEASYSQRHMSFFRRKVANDILRGSYDYPL